LVIYKNSYGTSLRVENVYMEADPPPLMKGLYYQQTRYIDIGLE